ncbi:hypothetical protein BDK51DRAFT_44251 [Blyttiomyces helicus]|uniref:Uncharacterized protein n=1 Tax=Blyttiomyces helicus TaxID=388810 RepID=A0A4P9W860_9FUNG|nr:hypothetical protein BDK51DRAFT_44251 [Blyttiomyces helicus]|eukprot:RKO87623.1 hypothetical protein BDK51DRAFT_44251 [Blyttiomyces helicus]
MLNLHAARGADSIENSPGPQRTVADQQDADILSHDVTAAEGEFEVDGDAGSVRAGQEEDAAKDVRFTASGNLEQTGVLNLGDFGMALWDGYGVAGLRASQARIGQNENLKSGFIVSCGFIVPDHLPVQRWTYFICDARRYYNRHCRAPWIVRNTQQKAPRKSEVREVKCSKSDGTRMGWTGSCDTRNRRSAKATMIQDGMCQEQARSGSSNGQHWSAAARLLDEHCRQGNGSPQTLAPCKACQQAKRIVDRREGTPGFRLGGLTTDFSPKSWNVLSSSSLHLPIISPSTSHPNRLLKVSGLDEMNCEGRVTSLFPKVEVPSPHLWGLKKPDLVGGHGLTKNTESDPASCPRGWLEDAENIPDVPSDTEARPQSGSQQALSC